MKKKLPLAAMMISISVAAADLRVDFVPQFNGTPLAFDALANQITGGQKISVTRLDFLLSDFALRETNGVWIEQKNIFAFIGARDGKTNFTLANVPARNYDALRFQIGLPPEINHGDIAQWPANHPLNPGVNHLYWGWSREYVFLAFEGRWQNGKNESGFSYHIATDRELMTIELPAALNLNSSAKFKLRWTPPKIFPRQIKLH
ncbi:MAG TPA: MbnP family protein [Verrucomicrobiae bacterium]|nr:MbnP family protein [Verrucomicrobiae bacterium]